MLEKDKLVHCSITYRIASGLGVTSLSVDPIKEKADYWVEATRDDYCKGRSTTRRSDYKSATGLSASPLSLCDDDLGPVTLSAPSGYSNYIWQQGTTRLGETRTVSVSPSSSTTYTSRYQVSSDTQCPVREGYVTVDVDPCPVCDINESRNTTHGLNFSLPGQPAGVRVYIKFYPDKLPDALSIDIGSSNVVNSGPVIKDNPNTLCAAVVPSFYTTSFVVSNSQANSPLNVTIASETCEFPASGWTLEVNCGDPATVVSDPNSSNKIKRDGGLSAKYNKESKIIELDRIFHKETKAYLIDGNSKIVEMIIEGDRILQKKIEPGVYQLIIVDEGRDLLYNLNIPE